MFRYLVAVWEPRKQEHLGLSTMVSQRLRESKASWELALAQPGLFVYCIRDVHSSDNVVHMDGAPGVILGTIFDSALDPYKQSPRVTALTRVEVERIASTSGKSLVDSHWGSYVLILKGLPTTQSVYVFRGPASRLPCLFAEARGVRFFFSRVEDFFSLGLLCPSVNFDSIRAQVTCGDYITSATAIEGVEAVLPGEAVEVTDGSIRRNAYWSPGLLARKEPVSGFAEAVGLMECRTRACINAWSSLHDSIIVALSGGFDSSLVLSCLREARNAPHVVGINFYDRAAADERRFARSMARKTGFEVVEREWNQRVDFKDMLNCALTPSPMLHFTAIDLEPTCISLAHERRASAIFSGDLGDDVFGRACGPEFIADCMWRYGFGRKLIGAAADYAQFKKVSVWNALSSGRQYRTWLASHPYWSVYLYKRKFGAEPAGNAHRLVSDDVIAGYEKELPRFIHPWFRDVSEIPPGWCQMVNGLIITNWTQSPFGGQYDSMFLSPLASQPLLQAYARIPANFHLIGGLSGAVMRSAFSNAFSQEVLTRGRSKGTPVIWLIEMVERNRTFLREFLVDGMLVAEGILDRKKVEAAVSRDVGRSKIDIAAFIVALFVEAWLHKIAQVRLRAAA